MEARSGRGQRRPALLSAAPQHGGVAFRARIRFRHTTGSGRLVFCEGPEEGLVIVQIFVRDNNVDQALRALKKKLQREGVYREMKLRRHYEKPSEKRAREKAAAVRRARKLERKRLERDGVK